MQLPPRSDVDATHRFDLTKLYETPEDWGAARDDLAAGLDDLDALATDPPTTTAELRALLAETASCHRDRQRLDLYATLSANVATDSPGASERERALRELDATFDTAVAAVVRALGDVDAERFERMLASLDDARYYARNLRKQAEHVREPAVEAIVADHEETRSGATRILRAVTTEDFDPPTVDRPDGETVAIRPGNYRTALSHPDRDYRRRVYEAYHRERDRFAATLVRASAEKLQAAATEADVRNYDSVRDRDLRGTYPESGLEPAVPESLHDTLLSAVRANLDPYHRAQRVRRKRLGVDRLRPWDRRVPVVDDAAPDVDYERARALIVDALEPLGDAYVDRVDAFLDDRRVDVFPTQDKRTDIPAYCPSSAADGAFVLANFQGDVRTTFYLAHELGHAMNVAAHRAGPTRYATAPSAVCEVPSLLHEVLLAEHCIEQGGALAAHAANRLVECVAGNLYRNARTAAYNHALAKTVETGDELTVERARETHAELLDEFDPVYDREGVPERVVDVGMRIPYSSYQYVLGATGALAVRDALRDGERSADEYWQFLERTGSRPPVDSFEALGVDVRTDAPYERAAATFDGYLDAL
jgi:oligoendopeptidase F